MHNSYEQGLVDGEFDAMSSSGYDPEYGISETDSYPEYMDGYDNGWELGIRKRKGEETCPAT